MAKLSLFILKRGGCKGLMGFKSLLKIDPSSSVLVQVFASHVVDTFSESFHCIFLKVCLDLLFSHDDNFLDTLDTGWSRYQKSMQLLRDILMYMVWSFPVHCMFI